MSVNESKDLQALTEKVENVLGELRRHLDAPGAQARVFDAPGALARGTADLTTEARAAVTASLEERAAAALSARPLSIAELAQVLHEPSGRISSAIRPLRRRLWNAGSQTEPKWFLPPIADSSPEQFAAAIQALVRLRPMTTSELEHATGTRGRKRVWHALLRLHDAPGSRLVRHGDPRRPLWFWLDEAIDTARLGSVRHAGERRAAAPRGSAATV